MPTPAVVVSEPYDREGALRRHGLPASSVFESAVRQGDVQRRQVTANDVMSAGGFNAWARTTRVLRDMTGGDWAPVNAPIPAIENGSTMIIVVAGDHRTGLEGPNPKTKNKRKTAWRNLLGVTSSAPQLFEGFDPGPLVSDLDVWVLLTWPTTGGVRAEISRPLGVDVVEHRLTDWDVRILFGELRPDDGKKLEKPRSGDDSSGAAGPFPHDIVRRKSS